MVTAAVAEPEVRETTTRQALVDQPLPTETPTQKRDRLRQVLRSRGIDPLTIESIPGNCEHQVGCQIMDYETHLAKMN